MHEGIDIISLQSIHQPAAQGKVSAGPAETFGKVCRFGCGKRLARLGTAALNFAHQV
jgi:hypothetical protein